MATNPDLGQRIHIETTLAEDDPARAIPGTAIVDDDQGCPVHLAQFNVRVTTTVTTGVTTVLRECPDCGAFISKAVLPTERPDLVDAAASVSEWHRRYLENPEAATPGYLRKAKPPRTPPRPRPTPPSTPA